MLRTIATTRQRARRPGVRRRNRTPIRADILHGTQSPVAVLSAPIRAARMTAMVKSPAHWTQPASDKASAAAEQRQLKPGKSDLATPRDMDWHKAAKEQGLGFSCNPNVVLVRGDNPAAGEYR